MSALVTQGAGGSTDGAGTYPGLPAGSPIEWGLLAFARREPLAGLLGLQSAALQSTSAQPITSKGITVNPTTALVDGVIQGTLQATSARGATLTFTNVDTYGKDGGKLDLGTVPLAPTPGATPVVKTDPQSYTVLPYGTWLDAGGTKGAQTFDVRVREVTQFDSFVVNIPLVGLVAAPVINLLQQLPLISDLLAPIIGSSIVATVRVDVADLAPGDTPVAFTYKVKSFDGALIRTNFFPASGLAEGETAPTALFGPGLGGAGATDPYGQTNSASFVPDVSVLRGAGYNVVTWDPRGEYDSGGILQLDNPFFEGRDASALVSWFAGNPLTKLDAPGDPAVGMVGGSYGGGIQWVTAGTDPRIDAVVPGIAWYSLNQSLYPSDTFKTAWGNFLILALQLLPRLEGADGSRINNLIYQGVLTGNLFNWVSESVQSFAASSGPTVLLNKLTAPALLVQGTVDSLFPLAQAVTNAQTILANPYGTPVKMIWFCGGHGRCADPINPEQQNGIYRDTIAWLDRYVADKTAPADIPTFQWYDQAGQYYSSDLLPFQDGFNKPAPYRTTADGGSLAIIPVVGGSGSTGGESVFPFPVNTLLGFESTKAGNALNIDVKPAVGSQIVGAPTLSFNYSGVGTGSAVFAQLVDNKTDRVVGSIITPVPVKLDGKTHTVSIPLEDIAYTVYDAKDTLMLQIVASSTLYQNSSVGVINVSDVKLDLPVRA